MYLLFHKEGSCDALYFVNYGQVSVEKSIENNWTTIDILGKYVLFYLFCYNLYKIQIF